MTVEPGYGGQKYITKCNEKIKLARELFRDKIRTVLQEKYDFYAMKGIGNPFAGEQVIREHFKELQGKLYRPYSDRNLYALALEKKEGLDSTKSDVYKLLENHFILEIIHVRNLRKKWINTRNNTLTLQHHQDGYQSIMSKGILTGTLS